MPVVTTIGDTGGSFPGEGDWTVTRQYRVVMDAPGAGANEVVSALVNATGLSYNAQHPVLGLWVIDYQPTLQSTPDSFRVWTVDVIFSSRPVNNPPEENKTSDPLLEPPEVEKVTNRRERAVEKDRNGDAVLNVVNRPYDPPLTIWKPNGVLRITRNEANYSFTTHDEPYIGRMNSTTFLGAAAGTVLCNDITARQLRKVVQDAFGEPAYLLKYWRVSYEFEYDPDGWNELYKILQADFVQLTEDGSGQVNIAVDPETGELSDDGEPTRVPWPLDADGRAIPKSQLPGTSYYLQHELIKEADFNALGLSI